MRALAGLLALTVACTAPPPAASTPAPTPETGTLSVTALLDLSGPRAAIGAQQRGALELWTQQTRSGAAVKVRTIDVASSGAKLLIELRRAAVEQPADAVIVGAPVPYDNTFGRAIDVAALPVLLTQPLAEDPAGRPGGRWAFSLAPTFGRLAALAVDDARERSVLRPALVLADGRERVDQMASAIDAEMDRRRLDPLTRVNASADGSVAPFVRSSLSVVRSVHCTSLVASCISLAQAARGIGAPTFFYLSYLTTPADLAASGDLAQRAVFPSSRGLLPTSTRPLSTRDEARDRFLRSFSERHGAPGTHAAVAYDALSLLAEAAAISSPDDRGALRDALERITMPLIATTYSFGSERHVGFDATDLAYLRWSGSSLAPALLPSLGTGLQTPTPAPSPARSPSPSPTASPSRSPTASP